MKDRVLWMSGLSSTGVSTYFSEISVLHKRGLIAFKVTALCSKFLIVFKGLPSAAGE